MLPLEKRDQYTQSAIRAYFSSKWNWLDLGGHILMIIAIILHTNLSSESFHWARKFYALTLYIAYLRLIHIFYANDKIGPLVIMIKKMVSDTTLHWNVIFLAVFIYLSIACRFIYHNCQLSLYFVFLRCMIFWPSLLSSPSLYLPMLCPSGPWNSQTCHPLGPLL